MPIRSHHQVVQVPVTNTQDVGDDAIACTAADEILQHFWADSIGVVRTETRRLLCLARAQRVLRAKELLHVVLVLPQNSGQVHSVGNKLDDAVHRGECYHLVWGKLQVETILLQDGVHQDDELQHKLILPQVVPFFHHDSLHPPLLPRVASLAHLTCQNSRGHCGFGQGASIREHPKQGILRIDWERHADTESAREIQGRLLISWS
mmetsp:Transcript_45143/g.104597  ORF Transcript_45143/g.104597 Transcript_45143/m.104597 type:complete len:206 (-) Transcript_45143:1477-2094(-)